ncbi:MAG: hypothetical protein CFE45_02585, partial [Burkholderiales bacterium PBB5]
MQHARHADAAAAAMSFTDAQIIVLATPVFLLLMALEWALARGRGRSPDLRDTLASVSLGMVSQLTGLLARLFGLGLYALVFERLGRPGWALDQPLAWLAALGLYDLCYYWKHRAG